MKPKENYIMCLIGFNTALRAEDLLQLRVKDVYNKKADKFYIHIREAKTGKPQNFKLSKTVYIPLSEYIKKYDLSMSEYLFLGQYKQLKGAEYNKPITRQMAYSIVNQLAREAGIAYPFGMHSLRKTFGYMYVKHGGKLVTLQWMLNHASFRTTERYICWGSEDVESDREAMDLGFIIPLEGGT